MMRTSTNSAVEIHVSEKDDNLYAATIMPFDVTGYADTFDGAVDRAKEGLDRLLAAYEADGNLTEFLDESGIEYSYAYESPDADGW